jgi:glycosyltransferase involved in cell wall biosynthesis
MKQGLVSVIIPVFNRSRMLIEAVDSVLCQTHRFFEIILVDDGSTDDTPEVAASLVKEFPETVKSVAQPNSGPGAARNAGLYVASGEFVQYLDSDDVLHPKKFAMQIAALEANPDAGVSYCITLRTDPQTNELVPWARTAEHIDNIFPSFLPKRGWATLTPLWRRSACEAIGPWKPYRVMEDWEHDLRAGILGIRPVHVAEALCTVRDHGENRASGMNEGFTRDRMLYFFKAHESIWTIMNEQGLTDWSYLQQFSRTMFWIARMCGQRGLIHEAEYALDYTDQMTGIHNFPCTTKWFRRIRGVLGWRLTTFVGEGLKRCRN